MRHVDRRKVKGVIVIRGISRNEMLGEAYRSSLHIVRYRGQPRVQNDKGFPPEQLHEFRRYPSFDSALAFTVDARPTGRCTVAAPADEDFHVQPPFVRKALSWKAGTRKYARKSEKRAGYCLGVRAQGNVYCLLEATRPPNKNTRQEMSPLRNGRKRRISQREWRLALWTCLSATTQHSRPFFSFR